MTTDHEAKARSIVEPLIDYIAMEPMVLEIDDLASGIANALAEATEDLSRKLEEARGKIGELEERLEIDHCYVLPKDGSEELVRQELPPERRKTFPDGITARDATIRLLEENNAAKDARIAELESAIKPFVSHGRALGVYSGAEGPFWINTDTGHRDIPAEDFRTARTVLEGKQPNAETLAAMQELEDGGFSKFATVDDLMKDLNDDELEGKSNA